MAFRGSKYVHMANFLVLNCIFSFLLVSAAIVNLSEAEISYHRKGSITQNLIHPTGVTVDSTGKVYVTESTENRLLVYSTSGQYLKKLNGLDIPLSVAVDRTGNILIGNAGKGNVEVFDANFHFLYKLGGGDGEFSAPSSIAIDGSGNIYVSDIKENRIKIYTFDGKYKAQFGDDGSFHSPTSITINDKTGELLVTDLPIMETPDGPIGAARVQIFASGGILKTSFGAYGQGEGQLIRPMGVAVDSSGKIYVTDSFQNIVQIFDRSGKSLGAFYDPENPLRIPLGIGVDNNDSCYIASSNTGKVEIYKLSTRRIN